MSSAPTVALQTSSTAQKSLAPAASFANVLEDLSKDDTVEIHTQQSWSRKSISNVDHQEPSLIFQNIDIREWNAESGISEIHLFGVTNAGQSLLARIRDFPHYFHYPAPNGITKSDLDPLRERINQFLASRDTDSRESNGLQITIENQIGGIGETNKRSFLRISVVDHRNIPTIRDKSASVIVNDVIFYSSLHALVQGQIAYRGFFAVLQDSCGAYIPYTLRFMLDRQITTMTWLEVPTGKYDRIAPEGAISHCQIEVSLRADDLLVCSAMDGASSAPLRVLSFDIETDVPAEGFPKPESESVLQIGNMVSLCGQTHPFIRTIFTVDQCSPIAGAQVLSFKNEAEMLLAWQKFFLEVDPDVVIGYNVHNFDIPYLLKRAQVHELSDFPYFGRIKSVAQTVPKQWPITVYDCPGYEGRLLLDVLSHVRLYHRGLQAYSLNTVAMHFLQEKKEDINPRNIPLLQNGDPDSRQKLAVYCLKDVYLPLRLFKHLNCLEKEVKDARRLCVPYNAMRENRYWKNLAERYSRAVGKYLVRDSSNDRALFPAYSTPR